MNKSAVVKLSLFSVFLMVGTLASTQKISASSENMCAGQIRTEKLVIGADPIVEVSTWIGRSARATITENFNQKQLRIQIFQDENMGEVICQTQQAKLSKSNLDLSFDIELLNLEEDRIFTDIELDRMSDFYFGDSRIAQVYRVVDNQAEYSTELNGVVSSTFEFPIEKGSKGKSKIFSNVTSDYVRLDKGRVTLPIRIFVVSEQGEIASVNVSKKQLNGIPTISSGVELGLREVEASIRDAATATAKTFSFTGNINAVLCKMEDSSK